MQGLAHGVQFALVGLCCLLSLPFGFGICGAGWVLLCFVLNLATRYTSSGPLWGDAAGVEEGVGWSPGLVQGQPLPVSCPGLPGRRYKVICRGLLPVLGMEVPERG